MILAIDTASSTASVALGDREGVRASMQLATGLTHSEQLLPMVDAVLRISRSKPGEVTGIAVTAGPGSFTGLRIGLASAKGFALGWQVPVQGIGTLDALAQSAVLREGLICPILNARRGEVYTAVYRAEGLAMSALISPCAMALDALLDRLEGEVYFLGDGCDLYRSQLEDRGHVVAPVAARYLDASSLLTLYDPADETPWALAANRLQPFYLRESEAVLKWREAHPGETLDA